MAAAAKVPYGRDGGHSITPPSTPNTHQGIRMQPGCQRRSFVFWTTAHGGALLQVPHPTRGQAFSKTPLTTADRVHLRTSSIAPEPQAVAGEENGGNQGGPLLPSDNPAPYTSSQTPLLAVVPGGAVRGHHSPALPSLPLH